ncbi:MAG TPA: flotillin family protein [Clostridiales bacterium]|nr:flotillin family protein [Clostridiales bacterium]
MDLVLKVVPVLVVALVIMLILIIGYVKAPPDQAFIISGLKKEGKILVGRAGVRIPFLERLDKLYLGQMTVDIKTELSVPTNDFINVNVDAVAKVRIHTTEEGIKLASKNFLNKSSSDITLDLQDSLQGNMREIIGTLSLKEINTDRDSFSDQVMLKASKDMEKLGIEILSCNIQNVTDENGLIKDLGADNTSLIKRNAAIAKAQADRDVAIAQAEADKEANDARIISETEIEQRNNELEIRKAELKIVADAKKAEADAVYAVKEQEQRKNIETAKVNADIASAERSAVLKKQEVEVMKQKLDAEIRAQADAERYKQEQVAQSELFTRQKDAEAERFSKEQSAEGTRALGLAEADAIKAKALAEADGIDKKAEAMLKYGEAAVIEIIMQAMPEIAKNVAEPLSKVDKITMYGEGNNAKLIQDIVNGTSQVTEGISSSLGIDLKALISGFLGGKVSQAGENKQEDIIDLEDSTEQ